MAKARDIYRRIGSVESTKKITRTMEMVAASKFRSMPGYGLNRRGHIALQDHGDEVWFRNLSIVDLSD